MPQGMVLWETPIQSTTVALPGDGRSLLISQRRVASGTLVNLSRKEPQVYLEGLLTKEDQDYPRGRAICSLFLAFPEDREWCAFPCGGVHLCSRGCKSLVGLGDEGAL